MHIGFATQDPHSHYWMIVGYAARERAAELGIDSTTLTVNPLDTPAQITAINALVDQRVDALLVGPVVARGLVGAVERARAARIPVIVVASPLLDCAVTGIVQSNNRQGAELVAAYVVAQIGGAGAVAHLTGPTHLQDAVDRATTIRTALGRHLGVQVVFEQESPDWTPESGAALMGAALARHPDLRAVCVANDTLALGAIAAIAAAGRSGQIVVTGFDGTPEALQAIHEGRMSATVHQSLRGLGRTAVELGWRAARGEAVPPLTLIDVALVTSANLLDATLDAVYVLPNVLTNAIERGDALVRAARLKDEFLANMSHELRTPLNTILGMAETLREGVLGPINDEQTDAVRHIDESGRHLLALINDILDFSKVEASKLDLNTEEIVITQVCQASLRLVKQAATQKRLSVALNLDSPVTVLQADARRLKQMLVNLLSNAVKFTPEGGAIGLDVVGDRAAQCVRLTVWDTGIGIAADDLPRLFQPFVQLDSRLARQYTGTGLGLALVQRLAASHGGSVAVESTLGQGSRFTITLPWTPAVRVADPVASSDLAAPAVGQGAPLQRALVIEDSPTSAAQLARYVRELGVEAQVHPRGAGALEAALDGRPDVILLDIQLPDRSGWDVLVQLKADPRTLAIPVVVVSVVDDRPKGIALGAAEYLVKPIARQQLQETFATIASGGTSQTIPPAHPAALELPSAPQRPVILLAEDEENNIYTLATYLDAKGYQVVVARNGAEALQRAHAAAPALILMDIQMPGMDGLEAIRRLRATPTLAAIPIIALTALAMVGDRERCLAAGANDYLSKPVRLQELVHTIEAHRTTASADGRRER